MTKTREPQRGKVPGPWALGWKMLRSPSAAAEDCREPASWRSVLLVYAAFEVGHLLFFWLKPADFPDVGARQHAQGFLFWLRARLFDVPVQLGTIAIALACLRWLAEGNMLFRMVTTLAAAGLAAFPLAYYQAPWMSKPVFVAVGVLWMIPVPLLVRAWPKETILHAARFMLALNAIGIALLAPLALMTAARSQMGFMLSQGLVGFWFLGASALGLRAVTGTRLPRTFLAILFVMAFQACLVAFLHLSGLMPKEILKAIVYG